LAHLPWDDIEELWWETKEHNWPSFAHTLEAHRGQRRGLSEEVADHLIAYCYDMEREGHEFPGSAHQLYEMLTERFVGGAMGEERH
jgi:hypothetical protein